MACEESYSSLARRYDPVPYEENLVELTKTISGTIASVWMTIACFLDVCKAILAAFHQAGEEASPHDAGQAASEYFCV